MHDNLCVLDLESTGVNTKKDRIVQICVKINGVSKTRLINPTIPIPKEASQVHGITDDMVKDAPTFSQVANSLYDMLNGKDLCGFNSNVFDIPLLIEEFARCGIDFDVSHVKLIDVSNLYRRLHKRDLNTVYKQYTGNDIENAHDAESDVDATEVVLNCILEKHKELLEINLDLFCNYDKKRLDLQGKFEETDKGIILTFGKHKGEIASNHPDFLKWMIEKGDFQNDTIKLAKQIKDGKLK